MEREKREREGEVEVTQTGTPGTGKTQRKEAVAAPEAQREEARASGETQAVPEEPRQKEDSEETEDFAQMLEESATIQHFSRGERVKGRVLKVTEESIFLDLGSKSEGVMPLSERAEGGEPPSVGDEIQGFVMGMREGHLRISQALSSREAGLENLQQAYEDEVPVQGRIKGRNKGGFDVEIGGVRAFLPISQLTREFTEDLDEHIGRSYQFRITEFDSSGKNIVVSRRVLLEEEAAARGAKLKETLKEGDLVRGRVRSILDFGAFVDMGGLDGLIHVSDLSWGHVEHPSQVVELGQEVEVKILKLDWDRDRISLGLKQVEGDPWDKVEEQFQEGETYRGKVARLANYGAFVELAPGLDGLVHISNMVWDRRVAHPREVVKEGEEVVVQVLSIDRERKRLALGMKQVEGDPWETAAERFPPGSVHEGTVESVARFGVFVSLGKGITGLIPNREMATSPGTDHGKLFPQGTKVSVSIMEVDLDQRRIALSRKAVQSGDEERDWKSYMSQNSDGGFGTTFGDLLKKSQKKGKKRGR